MSDANDIFELIGDLYYSDTGFLRPGKSDPIRDTSSEENWDRFQTWMKEIYPISVLEACLRFKQHSEKATPEKVYVICLNDSVEAVVDGSESKATGIKDSLRESYWKREGRSFRDRDHYNTVGHWNLHVVPLLEE